MNVLWLSSNPIDILSNLSTCVGAAGYNKNSLKILKGRRFLISRLPWLSSHVRNTSQGFLQNHRSRRQNIAGESLYVCLENDLIEILSRSQFTRTFNNVNCSVDHEDQYFACFELYIAVNENIWQVSIDRPTTWAVAPPGLKKLYAKLRLSLPSPPLPLPFPSPSPSPSPPLPPPPLPPPLVNS